MTLDKPRILVVDDSAAARSRYFELLKGIGADIQTANDGIEAMQAVGAASFDLIITDIEMPKMNGIALCRKLQTTKETEHIPVIVASNFDSDRDVEAGFEAGAAAYLSKKDIESILANTVGEILWKFKNIRQRRILVVEDSRSTARFIEAGLSRHSYIVTVAGNGKMAQKAIGELKPDLILSDLKMPEMDGFTLCKWLKATPEFADIPFVAMSTDESSGAVVQRIIQYGAASFITKPFSMNQAAPLIDRILSDHFRIIFKERERLDGERTSLINSITSLVTALEARDSYTKGHSDAVSTIVAGTLAVSGAERHDVELLAIGGKMHDIGKIGIRDHILLKPDRLTDLEFTHIKEHPTIGKGILAPISSLQQIISVAYSHHERWDGKGYPLGLKGQEIPFWARLTAVADSFEAMTSDRPYRKGMPLSKAFQIIREVRGSQLCPDSVDLFFKFTETKEFQKWVSSKNECHPSIVT
jgi:response regulator RpfG family c-di-GMP phosphodiesterase